MGETGNVKYSPCITKEHLGTAGLPHEFERYFVERLTCQCWCQRVCLPPYIFLQCFSSVLPCCNENHMACFQERGQEGFNVENLAQESLQTSLEYPEQPLPAAR